MVCGKRQAIDWNDAGLRGFHRNDVRELYVDGIGIGLDVVERAVGILKNGRCILFRLLHVEKGKYMAGRNSKFHY